MSLFIDTEEALAFTKKNKLFKLQSRDMTVICQKTGKNDYRQVANPSIAEDKIRNNTLIDNKNEPVFTAIRFDIFQQYDNRAEQIQERQQIVKDLNKEAKKILSIKKAIACNSYGGKIAIVDLQNKTFKKIESGLVDPENISPYHESVIREAIFDSGINQYEKKYLREKKAWDSLK